MNRLCRTRGFFAEFALRQYRDLYVDYAALEQTTAKWSGVTCSLTGGVYKWAGWFIGIGIIISPMRSNRPMGVIRDSS